jgi:hypothetical protein
MTQTMRGFHSLLVLCTIGATLVVIPSQSVAQEPGQIGLIAKPGGSSSLPWSIPANGTRWERYTPGPWASLVQEAYTDNGDGVMSAGDEVVLDGTQYPITRVGPAAYCKGSVFNAVVDEEIYLGYFVLLPPSGFVPEMWSGPWSVYSLEGQPYDWPIENCYWVDLDEDGILSAGDRLGEIEWTTYRVFTIELVTVAAQVADFGAVSVEPTTWGRIKTLY